MGAGWLVARERSGPTQLPHGGRALLFAQYQLEQYALTHGLPPLKKFFSTDPAATAEYLRTQGIDPDEFDLAEESWFDPADALPVVRQLLQWLAEETDPVPQAAKVAADLKAVETVLAESAAADERFHLTTALPDRMPDI